MRSLSTIISPPSVSFRLYQNLQTSREKLFLGQMPFLVRAAWWKYQVDHFNSAAIGFVCTMMPQTEPKNRKLHLIVVSIAN